MFVYGVKLENCCKVGITKSVEERMKCYPEAIEIAVYDIGEDDGTKAVFVESYVMSKYKSETEYIKTQNFCEFKKVIEIAISNMPSEKWSYRNNRGKSSGLFG